MTTSHCTNRSSVTTGLGRADENDRETLTARGSTPSRVQRENSWTNHEIITQNETTAHQEKHQLRQQQMMISYGTTPGTKV